MSFKIVVDSCCELPEEYLQDPRFEIVPLGLEVRSGRVFEKSSGISSMSQICMPFPGEVPGGLLYRGRACICHYIIFSSEWKLQQRRAGNESVSGKIR